MEHVFSVALVIVGGIGGLMLLSYVLTSGDQQTPQEGFIRERNGDWRAVTVLVTEQTTAHEEQGNDRSVLGLMLAAVVVTAGILIMLASLGP